MGHNCVPRHTLDSHPHPKIQRKTEMNSNASPNSTATATLTKVSDRRVLIPHVFHICPKKAKCDSPLFYPGPAPFPDLHPPSFTPVFYASNLLKLNHGSPCTLPLVQPKCVWCALQAPLSAAGFPRNLAFKGWESPPLAPLQNNKTGTVFEILRPGACVRSQ